MHCTGTARALHIAEHEVSLGLRVRLRRLRQDEGLVLVLVSMLVLRPVRVIEPRTSRCCRAASSSGSMPRT